MENRIDRWPYLTPELPGSGGRIRQHQEDFFVEEVPLYLPSGKGTHLYLFIEKRGIPTFEAIGKLARALDQKTKDFGVAGLKDSDAVTRQYISIEHVPLSAIQNLELEEIKILDASYHGNKLKLGHLKGNHFRIVIRDPAPEALEKAKAILAQLSRTGVPNFYGPQRFGNFSNTHLLGLSILKKDFKGFVDILVGTPRDGKGGEYDRVIHCYQQGDYEGALSVLGRTYKYERRVLEILLRRKGRFDKAVAGLDKRMLQFYFSAFQSHLFNRYLEKRLPLYDRLEEGEVAYIHRNGASFLVEDPEQETGRLAAFEISPSGPLFGNKMLKAQGNPGVLEAQILTETGLELDKMKGVFGIRLRGARRPLRVPLEEYEIKERVNGLELSFFLPLGAFATVLLREVMKDIES